ncbi:MAG: diaminopropionate ammonia-lyase, partial [Longimicrobiales bacterium]
PTASDLAAGRHADVAGAIVVTCATDGNHGRAVAWGARAFGCRCVVYLHEHVSAGREAAIAGYGAEIVRVAGNYDDSVQRAQRDAERHGRFVISDTAYPGCEDVPRDVMQGYTLLVAEVMEQLSRGAPPTHIFVQAGVGGLAAAVTAHLWQTLGAGRPRIVVVEPERAACVLASAEAGRTVELAGDIDTVMACLSAGEPSTLAWRILDRGADAFVAIPDAAAVFAMRRLARPVTGDAPVVAGESGAAGIGALLALGGDDDARRRLGLGPDARVLCINTEGATDPEIWRGIVDGA